MATDLGVTSQSQAVDNLKAGDNKTMSLLIDAAATVEVGQVVQYENVADNYVDYTSGMALEHYAVIAEAKTIAADTQILCIVSGDVRMEALNAVAQADAEIKTALAKHGIFVRDSAVT